MPSFPDSFWHSATAEASVHALVIDNDMVVVQTSCQYFTLKSKLNLSQTRAIQSEHMVKKCISSGYVQWKLRVKTISRCRDMGSKMYIQMLTFSGNIKLCHSYKIQRLLYWSARCFLFFFYYRYLHSHQFMPPRSLQAKVPSSHSN